MEKDSVLMQCKSLLKLTERYLAKTTDESTLKKLMPNPTLSQIRIIGYIIHNEKSDVYQKDLEKVLNLRRATVSGILHTMEKNGLITRAAAIDDARSKKIILSPVAKEIFLANAKQISTLEQILINNIKSKDLKIFFKVIEQMQENIKKKGD